MKRRFKFIVLLGVITVFSLGLAGCVSEDSDDQIRRDGYNHVVAYDCQGGKIGNYEVRRNYYQNKSYLIQPGLLPSKLPAPIRYGYTLLGWTPFRTTVKEPVYETDENGVQTEVEPGIYEYGDYWDFQVMRFDSDWDYIKDQVVITEENEILTYTLTLYAEWREKCFYTIHGGDEPVLVYVEDGGIIEKPNLPPEKEGYSLVGYFADPECTQPFVFGLPHPGTVDPETGRRGVDIYTKWMEGSFTAVTDASEFKTALRSNQNIILMNDIEFAEGELFNYIPTYSGTILGNNYTVRGAVLDIQQQRVLGATEYAYGMIGALQNATVKDLTLDITVKVELGLRGADIYVGLLAGKAEGNTVIENCTFRGSVIIKRKSTVPENEIHCEKLFGKVSDASEIDANQEEITVTMEVI